MIAAIGGNADFELRLDMCASGGFRAKALCEWHSKAMNSQTDRHPNNQQNPCIKRQLFIKYAAETTVAIGIKGGGTFKRRSKFRIR